MNDRKNRRDNQEWTIQKKWHNGYTRHRTKTIKTKNTTQKTKTDEQHEPYHKPAVNPVPASYETPTGY